MNFTDLNFLYFFCFFLFTYWFSPIPKNYTIWIGSYLFYGLWEIRFLFLLVLLSLVNFYGANFLNSLKPNRHRKLTITLILAINLSVLGFFKYFNFFAEAFINLLGLIGLSSSWTTLNVLVPIGVSFYVFQVSSYSVDVYRREIPPAKDFVSFSAFVAYFPHMAAGPIMRASSLLKQIDSPKTSISQSELVSGVTLIVVGLIRKVVIADTLAPVVFRIYENSESFDWKSLMLATIAFGIQIYGDFSGYSNMARGISRLIGIELIVNFRQPYFSPNIKQFWRRWHISLSTWFRDYVYIPLGGNRSENELLIARNTFLVMILAGIWHGAALGFILWGVLHALGLFVHRLWNNKSAKFKLSKRLHNSTVKGIFNFLSTLVTVSFVMILWIPFRNPNLGDSLTILTRLLERAGGIFDPRDLLVVIQSLVIALVIDLFEMWWFKKDSSVSSRFIGKYPLHLGVACGLLGSLILLFASADVVPFVYFQF